MISFVLLFVALFYLQCHSVQLVTVTVQVYSLTFGLFIIYR